MSLIDNMSKVAMTSEFPSDKIVFADSDSIASSLGVDIGGYMKLYTIPHGLTRPLAVRLKWSTDNVTFVDGGNSTRDGDTSFLPTIAYSDDTNVYILSGVTTGTMYYRLVGMWLDDYDGSNPSVDPYNDPTKPFNFDSRLNVQSIYMQGELATDGTSADELSIEHNLGYYPDVWVYFESFSGEVWPAYAGGANNFFLYDFTNQAELDFRIYTDRVDFDYVGPAEVRRIFYRIYTE